MKKLFVSFFLLFFFSSVCAHAQYSPQQQPSPPESPLRTTKKVPNYASLVLDWGFDFLRGAPDEMKPSFFWSRLNNIYAYYNIRIMQSRFAVGLGIGLGREGYQFRKYQDKDYYTLVRDSQTRNVKLEKAKKVLTDSKEVFSSAFDMSYLDALLEARFSTNHKYPKESFFVAIGGKLGMLWFSSTTLYYKEDGQTKWRTTAENFGLKSLRYGAHVRIGWGRLGLFYAITLSPLFDGGKGFNQNEVKAHSAGISVDLF